MHRASVPVTCIAALALVVPAVGVPGLQVSDSTVRPAASTVAAHRTLRRLSRAVPPVTREFIGRVAEVSPSALRATQPAVGPVAQSTKTPNVAPRISGNTLRSTPPVRRAHAVQSGDSLWSISRKHGVTAERLAAANGLRLTAILSLEQVLVIPPAESLQRPVVAQTQESRTATRSEKPRTAARRVAPQAASVTHTVQSGDTLWNIAMRYGTRVEDLAEINDLGDSDRIKPGQRLSVSSQRQGAAQSGSRRRGAEPLMADLRGLRASEGFVWPSRGVLTSRFGWRYRRHHNGIDLASPRGTPIYAARDGVVEFSGRYYGYGKVVFLQHGGGLVTVYGHASELLVQPGQRVKKGQLIARVGCTGACTGSHLHFEVRVNGQPANPLRYLR
ncbi:MAG: peptidoglycan DD-metalloendopeptidase family protein [Armatimonadota bacterium]